VVPHRFYVTQQGSGGDRHVYAGRTRFIAEAMLAQFEQVTWPAAPVAGAVAARPAAPLMQVRDRARAAWK
jgi:DNA helicase-2/ATP-dependent DNA helicase PcrA